MFLFPSARTPGMDPGGGCRGCALLLPWECSWQLVFCKIWRYVFSAIKRHLLRRECFHSRGQHLCKFIGTKGSVCITKEFNSQRIVLGHQHGRRSIVWDTNMAAVTSCENTPFAIKICLRHQSVTPFLSGATSPKKSPGSVPELS